jgi:acetyl-CoA synthase
LTKGTTIDENIGQWEGINQKVNELTSGRLDRFSAYSIIIDPMTSCGCFECILAVVPEANGVLVVNREFGGETPLGMKFSSLAGTVGGGNQVPGFLGVGRKYLSSNKFISADGGFQRIVWMPKQLKEEMMEDLKARAKELGIPEFVDQIADESVAKTIEELVDFLKKVKHPALEMPPVM